MSTSVRIPLDLNTPRISSLAGNCFWDVVALTDHDLGVWTFVKDVDGKLYGSVRVPQNLRSGGSGSILLVTMSANTTASKVARWNIGAAAIADGETFNPGSLTDATSQDITMPTTAYLQKQITGFSLPTIIAGDEVIVGLFHEGAHGNDTHDTFNLLLLRAYLACQVD